MPRYHPQLWMVFFGPGRNPGTIARCLPRKWRHVCCASFQGDLGLWEYVNPARDRTYFLTLTPERFSEYFTLLLNTSTAIVEFPAHDERSFSPTFASCVGVVKGILGINSWALTPHDLYVELVHRRGASLVSHDGAKEISDHVISLWRRRSATTAGSPGGPGGGAGTADGGSARGSGAHQVDAGAVAGRN
jgi:hypothetical protein